MENLNEIDLCIKEQVHTEVLRVFHEMRSLRAVYIGV